MLSLADKQGFSRSGIEPRALTTLTVTGARGGVVKVTTMIGTSTFFIANRTH
jgi:hypothetical protein